MSFRSSLYILDASPLSDTCFANIFSQASACLFLLLTVSSADQIFLISTKSNLPIFSFRHPARVEIQCPKKRVNVAWLHIYFTTGLKGCYPGKFSSMDHEISGKHPIVSAPQISVWNAHQVMRKGNGQSGFSPPKVERLGSHTKWQQDGRRKGDCEQSTRAGTFVSKAGGWGLCHLQPLTCSVSSKAWLEFVSFFSHKLAVSSTSWDSPRDSWLLYFWPHHVACGILVPRPRIEPMVPAVEAQSLNHWTAREVPMLLLKLLFKKFQYVWIFHYYDRVGVGSHVYECQK